MHSVNRVRLAAVAAGLCGILTLAVASSATAKTPRRSMPASKRRVTNARRRSRGEAAAEKAQGMLVFPEVTKAAVGVGGSYGEGALIVGDKTAGYYSTTSASVGLQLGAQKSAQIIMFMTAEALDKFRNSSGWEAGANAQVTMIDEGKAADIELGPAQHAGHRLRLRSEGPDGRSFR